MDAIWQDLMTVGVPVAEKVARTIAVYAFLVVGLRLFGKRELGQLNPLDFIVLLLLSNTVQNAIIGNDNSLTGGLLGAAVLVGAEVHTARLGQIDRKIAELQAERVNLQRWQQWAQAPEHASQRLEEVVASQQDGSIWLQNRLFWADVDSASLHDSRVRDDIAAALECLASRLDHCKSPR